MNARPKNHALKIASAIPFLEALHTRENMFLEGLENLEDLDNVYDMLSSFMEKMVEDQLLTDIHLQTEKAAATQVFIFLGCAQKCLEKTDIAEDYPGSNPPFKCYLFCPYHKRTVGLSNAFSNGKYLFTEDWIPLWAQRYTRKNIQVEQDTPWESTPLLTHHVVALQKRKSKRTSATTSRVKDNSQHDASTITPEKTIPKQKPHLIPSERAPQEQKDDSRQEDAGFGSRFLFEEPNIHSNILTQLFDTMDPDKHSFVSPIQK